MSKLPSERLNDFVDNIIGPHEINCEIICVANDILDLKSIQNIRYMKKRIFGYLAIIVGTILTLTGVIGIILINI